METKFKPGTDPRRNTKGRPKGKPNKTTEAMRGVLADFLSDNLPDLQKQYDSLKAAEKLQFIDKLLKHVLPAPLPDYELMTEEQFEQYLKELRELKTGCFTGAGQTTPAEGKATNRQCETKP